MHGYVRKRTLRLCPNSPEVHTCARKRRRKCCRNCKVKYSSSSLKLPHIKRILVPNQGAAVAERLACSPPIKANRVQSAAGSLPDFRMWESCRTMSLASGFSRVSPRFSRPCILAPLNTHLITLFGSQDLAVNTRPNLLTHSLISILDTLERRICADDLNALHVYSEYSHTQRRSRNGRTANLMSAGVRNFVLVSLGQAQRVMNFCVCPGQRNRPPWFPNQAPQEEDDCAGGGGGGVGRNSAVLIGKVLVCATPVDDAGTLRNSIVPGCETIRNLPRIHQRINPSMQRRVDACIRADGGKF
ncbi:hypothetical protein PR048_010548 [Dryococelus australis]|uniref:Uncharacterized protein n=1 Tax=Dryococelus australis TaxID=614101 RepID=A0ABQ9I459_9NEOP|nr:hypothetical protein PR048_010548 [Dryococelus australis]